jgi:hypothetical protein
MSCNSLGSLNCFVIRATRDLQRGLQLKFDDHLNENELGSRTFVYSPFLHN